MNSVPVQLSRSVITCLSLSGKKDIMSRQIRCLQNSGRYFSSDNKSRILPTSTKNSDFVVKDFHPVISNNSQKNYPKSFSITAASRISDEKVPEGNPPTEETPAPLVIVERMKQFHIMTISMNRAKKRNCVNKEMAQELLDAFNEFEADDEMHVAVFHGIGGNFSAGYDLGELAEIDESELANTIASQMYDRGPLGPTRMEFTKPVIAAIEGWCVAGGLELALMADLRVADVDAKLGFLNRRFGVPLIDGGSVRLPELIGLSRAMDLILTGRIIDANEAHSMGLVNQVSKTGTAFGRALEMAKGISKHPQECMKKDRASAIHATFASTSLEASLNYEGMEGLQVLSKESIKGAKKFVSGLGKHGKFNVEPVAEQQEWQKEYDQMLKDTKK